MTLEENKATKLANFKVLGFWIVTTCSLVGRQRRFGETCCPCIQV